MTLEIGTHKRNKHKGFAMMEVMVSVAILSTACLFMARSLAYSVRAIRNAQNYYLAALGVERALWIKQGDPAGAANDWPKAEFLMEPQWNMEKKSSGRPQIVQSEIVLTWNPAPGKKDHVRLSRYIFVP